MPKQFLPVVLTANDLIEGDSVFLGRCGWVRDIREARVAASEAEAEALSGIGREAEAGNVVVGAYLVEVALDAGIPEPVLRRERIRASRVPTIAYGPAERRERVAA
jgi:sulfite reductase (NADPH) hemoprotein beta-component